jgi:hypothetical protein
MSGTPAAERNTESEGARKMDKAAYTALEERGVTSPPRRRRARRRGEHQSAPGQEAQGYFQPLDRQITTTIRCGRAGAAAVLLGQRRPRSAHPFLVEGRRRRSIDAPAGRGVDVDHRLPPLPTGRRRRHNQSTELQAPPPPPQGVRRCYERSMEYLAQVTILHVSNPAWHKPESLPEQQP